MPRSTDVKLIIQPDDGLTPLLLAIKRAKKTIDIVIFRFDRTELEKALAAAVGRGVVVRALIAHTNRGGEKRLRKLELSFLERGVTVCAHRRRPDALSRQDDDRRRRALRLRLQLHRARHRDRSRSFGVVTQRSEAGQGGERRCSRPTRPASPTRRATTGWSSAPRTSRKTARATSSRARRSSC